MTGEMYSLLAVFMHYAEHEEKEKAIQLTYAEKAESYIETNYSYPITVEEIASYVGISRSHLFRSFQNYMNRSPKEYLTEYRIKQACRLLRETDLSVSAIAYSVGFENNLYFSKAFRKQKGESPSEYRKSREEKYDGISCKTERFASIREEEHILESERNQRQRCNGAKQKNMDADLGVGSSAALFSI